MAEGNDRVETPHSRRTRRRPLSPTDWTPLLAERVFVLTLESGNPAIMQTALQTGNFASSARAEFALTDPGSANSKRWASRCGEHQSKAQRSNTAIASGVGVAEVKGLNLRASCWSTKDTPRGRWQRLRMSPRWRSTTNSVIRNCQMRMVLTTPEGSKLGNAQHCSAVSSRMIASTVALRTRWSSRSPAAPICLRLVMIDHDNVDKCTQDQAACRWASLKVLPPCDRSRHRRAQPPRRSSLMILSS